MEVRRLVKGVSLLKNDDVYFRFVSNFGFLPCSSISSYLRPFVLLSLHSSRDRNGIVLLLILYLSAMLSLVAGISRQICSQSHFD